jgi:predicted amidohydrolase YtcJ
VASYNPWVALHWITTGKTIGGTQVMARENTLDRTTALKLLSLNGYALIKEVSKGKIQVGYLADLIILDRDYFSIPETEIPGTTALLTMVDGQIVFAQKGFKGFAPNRLPVVPSWSPIGFYGGYQD